MVKEIRNIEDLQNERTRLREEYQSGKVSIQQQFIKVKEELSPERLITSIFNKLVNKYLAPQSLASEIGSKIGNYLIKVILNKFFSPKNKST